jgi:hypothetical protein
MGWASLPAFNPHRRDACATSFMVLGRPEAHEWLVPKLQLGNPIASKAPALRVNHLFTAPCAPSRSLGEIYVPKQFLMGLSAHP